VNKFVVCVGVRIAAMKTQGEKATFAMDIRGDHLPSQVVMDLTLSQRAGSGGGRVCRG